MPRLDISAAARSDQTNRVKEFSIAPLQLDSATGQQETEWTNTRGQEYYGYFEKVPDLKSAIIMKAIWIVGRGWITDPRNKLKLELISGWGKDTFDDIIFNLLIQMKVWGNSYAQIITKDGKLLSEGGQLVNLKPLDPGAMKHIANSDGRLKRFELLSKNKNGIPRKFKPEEIFYLANNRVGDQIHGISDIEVMEKTILADEESFDDIKKAAHRQARPLLMFKIGTDNESKINTFIEKMDKATNKGENIYVPDDENAIRWEVIKTELGATLLAWRDDIRNKFYRTIGLPQIVPGAGGQSTESESKVIYLAFEQIVEREQRFIEQQIWSQLGIKINFIPPASLLNNLNTDQNKDILTASQPSDLIAGKGA